MRSLYSLILALAMGVVLSGCIVRAPAPQELPINNGIEANDAEEDDQPYVPEEEPVNIWTQDDTKDSSWNGIYEGTVRIEQRAELDPWAFAGDDNYETKTTECEQQIARNEFSENCPTNTVLYAVGVDGEELPREIISSTYSPVTENPSEIVIGCVSEEGWYAAPLWNLKTNLNGIISINDQDKLLAAADVEAELPVRITKRPYDIPGRGGSSCDIAFTRLQVVTE